MSAEVLKLKLSAPSDVYMGEGAMAEAARLAAGRKVFVVTDSNVAALYGDAMRAAFGSATVYAFPAGEKSKRAKTLLSVLEAMAKAGMTRKDLVVAMGGGVVGDLGGLAAALYMRGVEVMQIPTTLLAQVDSSVGGKTAVDHAGIKNLAGAFYQPRNVVIDPAFLRTLPRREIRCGLGEIIKTAALDAPLYEKLRRGRRNLFDSDLIASLARDAVRVKARVVQADEKESTGERKKLNVGHTLGHAVEMCVRRRSHGECVLFGMLLEIAAGGTADSDGDYIRGLTELIRAVAGKMPAFDVARAVEIAAHDKKNADGYIVAVVPVRPGETREVRFTAERLTAALERVCGEGRL